MGDLDSLDGVFQADGRTAAAPRRSAPVATIDHRALRANVEGLLLRGEDEFSVADLRHDAWGHGAPLVARTLARAGVDGFVVDDTDADAVVEAVPGTAVSTSGASTLDPREVYGLPGSAGIPVMRLSGFVLLAKSLKAGEGVSYGFTHRAGADTQIALVTGGYAQGIVRSLGDRVSVSIDGRSHPIVGRVAMDVCVVDIGDATVARGDAAVFFGSAPDEPDLAGWVEATGLTPAELVTSVGRQAPREHIS